MNLHLVNDEKFINGSINTFERFYPGKNIFIVQKSNSKNWKPRYVSGNDVKFLSLTNRKDVNAISDIVAKTGVTSIFVHYLTDAKAAILNSIRHKNKSIKTYWIFQGADLYGVLHKRFNYELIDNTSKPVKSINQRIASIISRIKFLAFYRAFPFASYKKFIKELDYFCFWNPYDFKLLKHHFDTDAEFKYFGYNASLAENLLPNTTVNDKVNIIVNNSASQNGNHRTVLDKLHLIGSNAFNKVVVPLSYGDSGVKKDVLEYGRTLFGDKFCPLTEFMAKDEYFKLLYDIDVAFFGARRQEAAGNIFLLLGLGVKVFLRKDNNMIHLLKDNGFIFFIFEDDLNTADDIKPLTSNEKLVNNKAYQDFYNPEKHTKMMENLIINV